MTLTKHCAYSAFETVFGSYHTRARSAYECALLLHGMYLITHGEVESEAELLYNVMSELAIMDQGRKRTKILNWRSQNRENALTKGGKTP